MVTGDSNCEGTLGNSLAADVVEDDGWVICCGIFYNFAYGWIGDGFDLFKMEVELAEVFDSGDLDTGDERSLWEVGGGNDDFGETVFGGDFDNVDDAADWFDLASKGEFANEELAGSVGREELLAECKHREGYRQIKVGSVFVELGGGEVDGEFAVGKREAGVGDGATDALASFVDGFVGHTNDREVGQATVAIAFDGDELAGESGRYDGENLASHGRSLADLIKCSKHKRGSECLHSGTGYGTICVSGADQRFRRIINDISASQ